MYYFRKYLFVTIIALFPFRFIDAQWVQAKGPSACSAVQNITVCGKMLCASVSGVGVFVSADTGLTWTEANLGFTNFYNYGIFSIDGNIITSIGINNNGKVDVKYIISTDGGNNWSEGCSNFPKSYSIVLFQSDSILLAGTSDLGIFKSINHGATWVRTDSGSDQLYINCFAVHNKTLFAGSNACILRSTDYGQTWERVDSGMTYDYANAIAVKGQKLYVGTYGGVYTSIDDGQSWQQTSYMGSTSFAQIDTNLFLANDGGVYQLASDGTTWNSISKGLYSNYFYSVVTMGKYLFASTSVGVFRTSDNGSTWKEVELRATTPKINTIYSNNNILLAGTSGGVFSSIDHGMTWLPSDNGMKGNTVVSFVSIAQGKNDTLIFAGTSGGLFYSSNNGKDWVEHDSGLSNKAITCLATDGTDLYAGIGINVFRSTDFGSSWMMIDTGLYYTPVSSINCKGKNLFVGKWTHLLRTINNGLTWSELNYGTIVSRINWFSFCDTNIFMGTGRINDGSVFISSNNGETWKTVSDGLGSNVGSVQYSYTSIRNTIFVGSSIGAFYSTNNGQQWNKINAVAPLSTQPVYTIAISDNNLLVGTYEQGIWVQSLDGFVTAIDNSKTVLPKQYYLSQNYPNPFNPSTVISFSLPQESFVTLKIYDLLGREIAIIVSEKLQAGTYNRQWNASGISSGIYFYRLQVLQSDGGKTGTFTETKKLILLK